MESPHKGVHSYRLVVTRRRASEILLLHNRSGWALPRVAIHPCQRLAEQLVTEAKKGWGLDTYCLFVPRRPADDLTGEGKCAVLESERHNDKAPSGTQWALRATASGGLNLSEARLVRESLEELDGYVQEESAGPFARPGWLRELFRWTREQVTPLGICLTGRFRQLNASPTFSLIRLEAEGGAVWFKATGEPNTHELPLTLAIRRLFPRHVPRVLGVHPRWNGWLTEEVAGVSLDEAAEFADWERAATELAELQITSTGKSADLLEAQAKDLRIPQVAKRIDSFLARMSELMALQEKATPPPLTKSELETLAEKLKEACAVVEELGLPDTLGHLDINPGNIVVTGDRCVFLDWAEGCVSHPFLTFEYLREHLGRSHIQEPAAGERLATAYLRRWEAFFFPEELRRAQALAPLLAAFAYAAASEFLRSPDLLHNPQIAGYFRSLTRRMHRESVQVALGGVRCLR